MSGPSPPGSPPPEVPEEFAAAYRAAYERALEAQGDGASHRQAESDGGDDELPRRRGPIRVGTHRSRSQSRIESTSPPPPPVPVPVREPEPEYDEDPTRLERVTSSRWFVPLLLILLALLMVFGAYAVGRAFAGRVNSDDTPKAAPTVVMSEDGAASQKQPVTNQQPQQGAWAGTVVPLGGIHAKAGCTSVDGVDASGKPISYAARNLVDGAADTTWRCDGRAVGEKITLTWDQKQPIGQVGLIPGYAKTDDKTHANRYAENNRVTLVRWTVGDTVVEQRIPDDPADRSLRLLRVPRTTTNQVELQILDVAKGSRDTTAISEVQVGRAS